MWKRASMFVVVMLLGVAACATAPKSAEDRASLERSSAQELQRMMAADPGLSPLLSRSYGYAIFPDVGKGGLIVGGAHGRGIAYEHGRPVGYVQLSSVSVGAQAGGQTFAELIVFNDPAKFQQLKAGPFDVGANASAVVLKMGAAAAAQTGPVNVFVNPHGGLMVDVSIAGQKMSFSPMG